MEQDAINVILTTLDIMVGQKNQIIEEFTFVINVVHIYIEDMINKGKRGTSKL